MAEEKKLTTDFLEAITIGGLEEAVAGRHYLVSCEPQHVEVTDEEHIVHTACRACIANCGVIAHVKNGQVVKLEGDPVDPFGKNRSLRSGRCIHHGSDAPGRIQYCRKRDVPAWDR